ncbi:hypothetical protein [Kitasatospora purpeofusca]|uniref:hypothetical protein n=1 Tax=Kitasatospora purpeofusca TaxID=67352 RepID=UPI0036AC0AFB
MSTPRPRESGQRMADAHAARIERAVAAGTLPADIGEALKDPGLSRWRAAAGFCVVDDFAQLHGPAFGTVEVPTDLVAGELPTRFDVADARLLRELYRVVLADGTAKQQAALLSPQLLSALWAPGLAEEPIMRVWEHRFPQLTSGR